MKQKMDLRVMAGTGEALRRLRRRRGWLQGELAARSSVGQAQISTYELGRAVPTLTTVDRLLLALEASVEELALALIWVGPVDDGEGAQRARRDLALFAFELDHLPEPLKPAAHEQLCSFARLLRDTANAEPPPRKRSKRRRRPA